MTIDKTLDVIRVSRKKVLDMTEGLSLQQLNCIPALMKNNILWNMAHLVATQQNVCYLKSGLSPLVDVSFIERYKPGTKPGGFIEAAEYEEIKQYLQLHIQRLEEDYKKGVFSGYNSFTSATYPGVTIDTIDDAIGFIAFHESLHLGYIMAMKHHTVS